MNKQRTQWREENQMLEIIPAEGWHAVFAIQMGEGDQYQLESSPLVCWARVRTLMRHLPTGKVDRSSPVDGIVGIGQADSITDYVENVDNFLGYRHVSQPLEEWQEALDEYITKGQCKGLEERK